MSGVVRFERRDRQKRVHETCLFCGKIIKGTPRALAGQKGIDWQTDWLAHIQKHMLGDPPGGSLTPLAHPLDNVFEAALRTAMSVAREHDRNK